jgi:hypothetical protein
MAKGNKRIQKRRGPGRPPRPNGPDPVIPVRLPKATAAKIQRLADEAGTTRSEIVRKIIEASLKER